MRPEPGHFLLEGKKKEFGNRLARGLTILVFDTDFPKLYLLESHFYLVKQQSIDSFRIHFYI